MMQVLTTPAVLISLDELAAMAEMPDDQLRNTLLSLIGEQQEKRKAEKREKEKNQKKEREESKRKEKSALGSRGVRGEETPLDVKFAAFWKAYPKKKQKSVAYKSFTKLSPDDALLERMLRAIESQKKTKQWMSDNGQFVPYPSTWLNQKRWEDEEDVRSDKPERDLEAEVQAWIDYGEDPYTARRFVNDGFFITD